MSYYASLRSDFRVVMSITISAQERCLVCLYLQLFVGGVMYYLRYMCLFAHSGVQHILCCVFVLFVDVFVLLPVSLNWQFLIAPSVFSSVYKTLIDWYEGNSKFEAKETCYYPNIQSISVL